MRATWERVRCWNPINPFLSSHGPPSIFRRSPRPGFFAGCDCRLPVWNFRLSLRANSAAGRASLFPAAGRPICIGPFPPIPPTRLIPVLDSHRRTGGRPWNRSNTMCPSKLDRRKNIDRVTRSPSSLRSTRSTLQLPKWTLGILAWTL